MHNCVYNIQTFTLIDTFTGVVLMHLAISSPRQGDRQTQGNLTFFEKINSPTQTTWQIFHQRTIQVVKTLWVTCPSGIPNPQKLDIDK